MQRRTFLRLASLIATITMTRSNTIEAATKERVIVIGAGMAGLAAARELVAQGHEVLILEGRDRIGGRIWTSNHWPDTPLDLGANWIHGVEGNPLTELAKVAKARTVLTSYDHSRTYGPSGNPLTREEQNQLEKWGKRIKKTILSAQDEDDDRSIQSTIEEAFSWTDLSDTERQLVDFLLNNNIEHEYAGSTKALSVHWFDDEDEDFGGDDALFLDGYQVLIRHLARGLPITLEEPITNIDWSTTPVKVTTTKAVYTASRVIVTLPLGVLKAGTVKFTPELPAAKRKAIKMLGMGVLNKCYLRFPHAFWPTDIDWLEHIPPNRGEWTSWTSFMRAAKWPVLLGFNAADHGLAIEGWSDQAIVDSAMQTLRRLFGSNIPDPLDYQVTRWGRDPFARGSYSFTALGALPEMYDQLAESLTDKLFFAGEATNRSYPATVHGAYLSGLRVAQEVVEAS